MDPVNIGIIIGGSVISILLLGLILGLSWYIEINWVQPLLQYDAYRHEMVYDAIGAYLWNFFATLLWIPFVILSALGAILSAIRANIWTLFFLFLAGGIALGVLTYHDSAFRGWLTIRQGVIMPFMNGFILPLLNILRLIYDATILFWDFIVDMRAFIEWGATVILIKCTINTQDANNLFVYFVNIFYVFSQDMIAWVEAGFLTADFDITNTLDAVGLFVDSGIAPFTCFCQAIGFFFQAAAMWFRMDVLHAAINCWLNTFISIIQIPINTVMRTTPLPQFNRTALLFCCAVKQTGDTLQNTVLLIAEGFWGVFTGDQLPQEVAEFLSAPYSHILSDPICAIGKAINQTLTAAVNFDALNQPTGIAYFQSAPVIDELRSAASAASSLMCLFNNDAQAFVDQALATLVYFLQFVWDWILGNVWYYLFGGPLPMFPSAPYEQFANFLQYYFPNYWLQVGFVSGNYTYSTGFALALDAAFITTQALGNLFANLMDSPALGGIVQHLLNIILCLLVQVPFNLISFIYPILFFETDPRTTLHQVNFNMLFNEMYFLAQSLGDSLRQFGPVNQQTNMTCTPELNETQDSVFCCAGNLVESLLDTIIQALQQIVYFLQDLGTLPTGNTQFCFFFIPFNESSGVPCIRIPDMGTAIFLLEQSISQFACAVFGIIPLYLYFACGFPPPPTPEPGQAPSQAIPCGHVSTCGAFLFEQILVLIIVVPLKIINSIMGMLLSGSDLLTTFEAYNSYIVQAYFYVFADIIEATALFLDCVYCAFISDASPNCDLTIYNLFVALANVVRELPVVVTELLFLVIKLFLTALVGIFNGNPIGAIVNFVVGFCTSVIGGLGKAIVDFFVALFNAVGLGFLGAAVQALYYGLCPLLQILLTILVFFVKALTWGALQINWPNFCCYGGSDCIPSTKRSDHQSVNIIDGVLYVSLENWLSAISLVYQWPQAATCNATMTYYSDKVWTNLTEWQQGEVMFCLMEVFWSLRSDDQPAIRNSTCDRLMIEYNGTAWFTIDILTRSTILDCMFSRLYTDAFRQGAGVMWLPQDILTNRERIFTFGAGVAYGMAIYWQFVSDRDVTSAVFLSAAYQKQWASLALNVSHYQGITTPDQITLFRSQYHLTDYFAWNNATQYDAVSNITVGTWNFLSHLIQSLTNTSAAFGDGITDPTVYLTYGYSLQNSASGMASSMMSIFSTFFQGIQGFAAYWSNPANLKKRDAALEKIWAGNRGIYEAMGREKDRMTAEYAAYRMNLDGLLNKGTQWNNQRKADAQMWQQCNASSQECQQFSHDYHQSLRHDNHSLMYKLVRWWDKLDLSINPVYKHPDLKIACGGNGPTAARGPLQLFDSRGRRLVKEGSRQECYNQTQSLFSYTNQRGRVVQETGRQRLWRFYQAFRKGSAAANRRWDGLVGVFNILKEKFYQGVIQKRTAQIADYLDQYRHGYSIQIETPVAGAPVTEEVDGSLELLERYHRQKGHIVYAPHHKREGESTYQLQKQAQALHCPGRRTHPVYEDAGCKDFDPSYVPPIQQQYATTQPRLPYEEASFAWRLENRANRPPRGVIVPLSANVRQISLSQWNAWSLTKAQDLLNLTCLTNATFGNSTLCAECFFLDNFLGRVEYALGWMDSYYAGGPFGEAVNTSLAYSQYVLNDAAPAVVGNGKVGPGDFPCKDGWVCSSQFISDPNPGIRFNDAAALIANETGNTTVTSNITLNFYYLNAYPVYIIITVFDWFWNWVVTVFVLFAAAASDPSGTFEATSEFFLDWWILCDWLGGSDFLGTRKRFSIGETIVLFAASYSFFAFLTIATIEINAVNLLLALISTAMAFAIYTTLFLTIYASYGLFCFPGLPVILADDLFYFLAYSVFAKCEWFFAFLIADPAYNSATCFPVGEVNFWTIINCVTNLGFGDIFANLIYLLQEYAPQVLQWIRTSQFPLVAMFYQIPYINQRINAFSGVNFNDQVIYRQYEGCGIIMTLLPNLILFIIVLYLFAFIWPLIIALLTIAWALLILLFQFFNLISLVWEDMFVSRESAAFTLSGLTDTAQPERVVARPRQVREPSLVVAHAGQDNVAPLQRLGTMLQRTRDNFVRDRKDL
jgi:hypothetical protein